MAWYRKFTEWAGIEVGREDWSIATKPPTVEPDESVIHRSHEGQPSLYFWGAVLTFIPPFVWGPILIILVAYYAKHSGVIVTDQRVILFSKTLPSGNFRVTEIPIQRITSVSQPRKIKPFENVLELIFRIGFVRIDYEEQTGGSTFLLIHDVKRPKRVVDAVNASMKQ